MARKPNEGKSPHYRTGQIGETKGEIIFYLIKGERSRKEIIEYIKFKQKIRTTRIIDRHIKELKDNHQIIQLDRRGKHNEAYFSINTSYQGLKSNFKFLSEYRDPIDVLGSSYFQNNINESILPNITHDFVIGMAHKIAEKIKLFAQEDKPFGEKSPDLSHFKDIMEEDLRNTFIMISKLKDPIDVNKLVTNLAFPRYDVECVINILKASPSALAYVFSLDKMSYVQSNMIFNMYWTYYFPDIMTFFEENIHGEQDLEFIKDMFTCLYEKERSIDSPLVTFLISYLLTDYLNANVIYSDWLNLFIIDIFTEEPEQLINLQEQLRREISS